MIRITKAVINNYRKLRKNVSLHFNKQMLFVGRNNSGKTSVFELFQKFYCKNGKFTLEDFNESILNQKGINDLFSAYEKIEKDFFEKAIDVDKRKIQLSELYNKFPYIEMKLYIASEETDNYSDIKGLLFEFDNNQELIIQSRFCINDIVTIFNDYNKYLMHLKQEREKRNIDEKELKDIDFFEFFQRELSTYYGITFFSTKEGKEENSKVDAAYIRSLFNIYIINASRDVDDTTE